MSDEDGLFGTIEAEITNGEFKGENLEIHFGPSPAATTITMNGDPVAGKAGFLTTIFI